MSNYPVMPDLEAAIVSALRASSTLQPTFNDRIATKLPPTPTYPFLTLGLTGGFRPVERWLVAATVEFQTWGADGQEASTAVAANLAESVVLGLLGIYDDAAVTGVEPILEPRSLADPETGRPRYVFEVRVYAHPVAA